MDRRLGGMMRQTRDLQPSYPPLDDIYLQPGGGVDRRLGGMMRQGRGSCATMSVRALVLTTDLINYIRPEMMRRFENIYHNRTRCGDNRIPSVIINQYCYAEGHMLNFPNTFKDRVTGDHYRTPYNFDDAGLVVIYNLMKTHDVKSALLSVNGGTSNHSMLVRRIDPILIVHDAANPDKDTRWLLANEDYGHLRYMWVAVPTGPRTEPSLEVLRQARLFNEQGSNIAKGEPVDFAQEEDVDASSDDDTPYVVPGRGVRIKHFDVGETPKPE